MGKNKNAWVNSRKWNRQIPSTMNRIKYRGEFLMVKKCINCWPEVTISFLSRWSHAHTKLVASSFRRFRSFVIVTTQLRWGTSLYVSGTNIQDATTMKSTKNASPAIVVPRKHRGPRPSGREKKRKRKPRHLWPHLWLRLDYALPRLNEERQIDRPSSLSDMFTPT